MKPPFPAGLAVLLPVLLLSACGDEPPPAIEIDRSGPTAEWRHVGGDSGGMQYSPLDQITADNVGSLEVAWTYHHGDVSDGSDGTTRTSFNATPIVAGDTLYFCTGKDRVIALDAETGEERWTFDPKPKLEKLHGPYPRVCRGVAYWEAPAAERAAGGACTARIFTGTIDSELIALDAATGEPCADFGEDGRVSLREGLGDVPAWEYYPTAAPIVLRDVVATGALVADNMRVDAPSGVVRAFDVRTGELRWGWDPVPPGWQWPDDWKDRPRTRWTPGTPNVWTFMSADPERNLLFVPTGNASPDYFAAARHGLDYYSSSVVALWGSTGTVIWHFQTVHKDVWDYDVPARPQLFTFRGDRGPVDAVAQITKMGHLFLLDRESGVPLFPVEERPVPQSDVPGEQLSPTQPFPTHIPPLHPSALTPDDAFGFSPWDRGKCREIIAGLRSEGLFTPASLEGSIEFPGSAGGPNWGGIAIDPERQVAFVNAMRVPSVIQLIPRDEYEALPDKTSTYPTELAPMVGAPYALRRGPLLSPLGAPCNPPPWGTFAAVDLVAGEILWEVPLGTSRDQAPWPIWQLQGDVGAPNLGGAIATAGGVVFIGATTDKYLRAFDAETGEEVWTERLPYTANATPMTYRLRPDSKQFVVVAAGGHGWSEPGDAVIAWTLREKEPEAAESE
jgi:quinoprotein glucose dehydrogenase